MIYIHAETIHKRTLQLFINQLDESYVAFTNTTFKTGKRRSADELAEMDAKNKFTEDDVSANQNLLTAN